MLTKISMLIVLVVVTKRMQNLMAHCKTKLTSECNYDSSICVMPLIHTCVATHTHVLLLAHLCVLFVSALKRVVQMCYKVVVNHQSSKFWQQHLSVILPVVAIIES